MAPTLLPDPAVDDSKNSTKEVFGDWRLNAGPEGFVTEGWSEGFMLGALIIMACITVANMRKGVLLHKLILLELLLAMSHGTFCFMAFEGYGWYLSSTAALLYCSYFTHNVVAWIKIKPFFKQPSGSFSPWTCKLVTWIYLTTLAATAPIFLFQIVNNFRFFNNINDLYQDLRPYEPLIKDPWWLFSVLTLFHVIRTSYNFPVFQLINKSPRFGILLAAIFLSFIFTGMDFLASLIDNLSVTNGINPYWKLALVFKCLTDNIMLDDFKTALRKLGANKFGASGGPQLNGFAIESSEKMSGHEMNEMENPLERLNTRERQTSLSGRALDPDEVLDSTGRGRRKMSVATPLGRVGTKISDLPPLPTLSRLSGWKRTAKEKAKEKTKNIKRKTAPFTGPRRGTTSDEPDERTNDEHVDFITMMNDTNPEDRRGAASGSSESTWELKVKDH